MLVILVIYSKSQMYLINIQIYIFNFLGEIRHSNTDKYGRKCWNAIQGFLEVTCMYNPEPFSAFKKISILYLNLTLNLPKTYALYMLFLHLNCMSVKCTQMIYTNLISTNRKLKHGWSELSFLKSSISVSYYCLTWRIIKL